MRVQIIAILEQVNPICQLDQMNVESLSTSNCKLLRITSLHMLMNYRNML